MRRFEGKERETLMQRHSVKKAVLCYQGGIAKKAVLVYQGRIVKKAVLCYQGGIANVFEVQCFNLAPYGRDAKRLLQGSFQQCEWYSRGLAAAGVSVTSMHCNQAGDISESVWSEDLEAAPFSDSAGPVFAMQVSV